MPIMLEGSCRCGAVRFSVASNTRYPYQLCYCSICRKTAGGGFAVNIMGDARTLAVAGRRTLRIYHAEIRNDEGNCETSSGERHFCSRCASALWLFSPEWPELVHPFASAIDTDLPVPPSRTHLMLKYKPSWVEPVIGPHDLVFQEYPEQSIEQWHRHHRLWVK
jgi:hypothetical protein